MKKDKKSIGMKAFHASVLLIATGSLLTASIATSVILRLPSALRRKPHEENE
jgi:hypothetical protein